MKETAKVIDTDGSRIKIGAFSATSQKIVIGYKRISPHGFSKKKHKKRTKKANVRELTLADFNNVGQGAANAVKAFLEGYKEGMDDIR